LFALRRSRLVASVSIGSTLSTSASRKSRTLAGNLRGDGGAHLATHNALYPQIAAENVAAAIRRGAL
jgi:hypothetical protein